MVSGIKALITKNIEWKLLSLAMATALWFAVVSSLNPMNTEFFQIQLSVRNDQALRANNLVLMNRQDLQGRMLGISVRATRSDLDALRSSLASFRAYVDLGPIDISQTMDIDEPMAINVRYEFPSFLQDQHYMVMSPPETVMLVIDRYVSEAFPVQVVRDGAVQPGFIYHPPIASPSTVNVSGPQTVIGMIDQVVAVIEISDADTDISRFSSIQVLDTRGVDITGDVGLSVPSVMVQVGVARYGDVPVWRPDVFHNAAEGFVFTGAVVSPATIEVVGDEQSLEAMQRSGIRLRPVSIYGRSESFYVVNDMREYLIDTTMHIRNLTPHETVTHIIIEPLVALEFEIDVQDIELTGNIRELELYEQTVTVTISAAQSIAEELSAEDITLSAVITYEALEQGSILVNTGLPPGVYQVGEIRIGLIDTRS
ncbi:MAG: CdaR family protein [Defluviitaleaceae bacterium]|nr:CdaR family protein [Defluviitaleaceae bacterium]